MFFAPHTVARSRSCRLRRCVAPPTTMRLAWATPMLRQLPGLRNWGRSPRLSPLLAGARLRVPYRAFAAEDTPSPPPPPPPPPYPRRARVPLGQVTTREERMKARRQRRKAMMAATFKSKYGHWWWIRMHFNSPRDVIAIVTIVMTTYGIYYYFSGLIGRTRSSFAENKLMQELEAEGVDPATSFHLFVYAAVAHAVQDDEKVTEHMGELRFAPDTMRMTPLVAHNQMIVSMNVYGTRRAGIVNVVFDRSVKQGLPVFTIRDFSVDSWDGQVFSLQMPPLYFEELVHEVQRRKASGERQAFLGMHA